MSAQQNYVNPQGQGFINESGNGKGATVPAEVANKFNWGAFVLSWIWGIGNKSYITFIIFATVLLSLTVILAPLAYIAQFALCIWFGVQGNKWAWQNKHFESIQAFHNYQKKWATAAAIVAILSILLSIIGFIAAFAMGMGAASTNY